MINQQNRDGIDDDSLLFNRLEKSLSRYLLDCGGFHL